MTDSQQKSARERILEAVADLFYREGMRAVGVDTVIARSGVAKMSLYRNFASKDDLVVAFLEQTEGTFWGWWDGVVARHPGDPRAQLLALFGALAKWTEHPKFRGCPFISASVEFRDTGHPALAVTSRHRDVVRARLRAMAEGAGARDPEALAGQLQLLMEGAYAGGRALGGAAVVSAAAVLVEAACGPA